MRAGLTKPQKTLVAIIESEGGRIVAVRNGGDHAKVDYTFDDKHFHTQSMPRGKTLSYRWEKNFRAEVRRSKPSTRELTQ